MSKSSHKYQLGRISEPDYEIHSDKFQPRKPKDSDLGRLDPNNLSEDEEEEDETKEALLAPEDADITLTKSGHRKSQKRRLKRPRRELRFCGLLPTTLLCISLSSFTALVILYKILPFLIYPFTSHSEPKYSTDGLRPQGAAAQAAKGTWATVGDSWDSHQGQKLPQTDTKLLLSNGSHTYHKTVIMVSLDGVKCVTPSSSLYLGH